MKKNARCNLLLADDDTDDCIFFKEVLEDLPYVVTLSTVNNGVALMKVLNEQMSDLPDALFLDLNMPLKSGFECLMEIKLIDKLKSLPIIIFSTSLNPTVVNKLYEQGANYYIRKPGEFPSLRKVIEEAIRLISQNSILPSRDKFIIQP
jgi:CheY-like chemotaxis protein